MELTGRAPTAVRVRETETGALWAHGGDPSPGSWDVPRAQWEQYASHYRETARRGAEVRALQPAREE